jgi:hypothetical protein
MSGRALVHIKRIRHLVACFSASDVYLDGEKVAVLLNGEEVTLELAPGFHSLYCQSGGLISETLQWEAREGQEDSIGCKMNSELLTWKYHQYFVWGTMIAFLNLIIMQRLHIPLIGITGMSILFICIFLQMGGAMWPFWCMHWRGEQQLFHFSLLVDKNNSLTLIPPPTLPTSPSSWCVPYFYLLSALGAPAFLTYYIYFILPALFYR